MKEMQLNLTEQRQNPLANLVLNHKELRATLNNGASRVEKADAFFKLAKLTEIVRIQPNIEDIERKAPEVVYPKWKTIAFYRHALELNPSNQEARRAYERLAGKTIEETVLARLPIDEYEPPAYLPVSPRLKKPLNGYLNEAQEIASYWSMQSEGDKNFIGEMDKQINKPMHPSCRISIGIPAYMEEKNIFRTLKAFTEQKDINPNEFEVIVFENHPKDKKRDNTKQEIERFQKLYPQFKIYHIYYCFPKMEPIGMFRKIVEDVGLKRRMEVKKSDPTKDFILATNDADSYGMKERSLRFVIDTFDKDPGIASITGKLDYPKEALAHFPTLHALIRFNAIYNIIAFRNGSNINTSGGASYARASMQAAIGGFDYKTKRGEDSERGFRQYYYGKGNSPLKSVLMNAARFYTDPRRAIDAISKDKVWVEQWQDINWQRNQGHILGTSWKDFNAPKLTTFNKAVLEKEINSSAYHMETIRLLKSNPESEEAKKRIHDLDRTMKFMGIKASRKDEQIIFVNTSKLEEGLKKFKTKVLRENHDNTYKTPKGGEK